jgi:hypothetical protein
MFAVRIAEQDPDHGSCRSTRRDGSMDPLATLIVSLGTLIVLDLAAIQLGGPRRSRSRTRPARSR